MQVKEVYHIGMDVHKRFSQVTEMNEQGTVRYKGRIDNEPYILEKYFSRLSPASVAMEATGNWYWICDLIERCGHSVKLAHPKKVRIIAESTIKTDDIDSETLAHLDRTNFLPLAYIPSQTVRDERELLRYRICLVRMRSSLKNRIHAVLAKRGIVHRFSDLFGKAGILFLETLDLGAVYTSEIKGYLILIEQLNTLIKRSEKEITRIAKANDMANLLVSVPGFSYFSALLMAAEIGDIARFASHKKLCAYGGVVSSTRQSADKHYQGHIIKDSNSYIRWILTEAVPKAIMKDMRLKSFYLKVFRKKGKSKAKIAAARKLLTSIYFMLKNNSHYKWHEQVTSNVKSHYAFAGKP